MNRDFGLIASAIFEAPARRKLGPLEAFSLSVKFVRSRGLFERLRWEIWSFAAREFVDVICPARYRGKLFKTSFRRHSTGPMMACLHCTRTLRCRTTIAENGGASGSRERHCLFVFLRQAQQGFLSVLHAKVSIKIAEIGSPAE